MAARKKTNQAALNRISAANKRRSNKNAKYSKDESRGYYGGSSVRSGRAREYVLHRDDPRHTSDTPVFTRYSDAIVKPNIKKKAAPKKSAIDFGNR